MVGYYSLSKWTWVHKKWKWGMSITNLFEFEDTARYTTPHYTILLYLEQETLFRENWKRLLNAN